MSSGLRRAVLKQSGKVDSLRHRFIKFVIGGRSDSRQDFRTRVGIKSRGQVESDDAIIAAFTSSSVAGEKSEKSGGGSRGDICGEAVVSSTVACGLVILSVKKLRKAEASIVDDEAAGKERRVVRHRREFNVFQRVRGLLACLLMSVL